MLCQKVRISIFLNGHTHEEWEPASAFHKNPSVFLVLHLLYRTKSSTLNNRPLSYFRQLIFLRHREFESFLFTFEILMLIMHTHTLKLFTAWWPWLQIYLLINVCGFQPVKIWYLGNGNCISCILGTLACNWDRSLFSWGFPFVWKLSVFPGLS